MQTTSLVPERILLLGLQGSGKTESYVSTAARYRATRTPGTFYVVNTDIPGTVERCNERYADWQENVQFTNAREWTSFQAVTDEYGEKAQSGDWLVIDSIDKAWLWIRDEWLGRKEKRLGKARGEDLFGVSEVEITGGEYNERINPAYQRWIMHLLDHERMPAHLLACTPSQPIVVEGMYSDSKSIIETFGEWGVRPMGNKHLAFQFHTCLLAKYHRGKYTLTTYGKDRSHQQIKDLEVTSEYPFPLAYLEDIAGWQV